MMLIVSHSPNLRGEIQISGSKNAALPIVVANYCVDQKVTLLNKPEIFDVINMETCFTSSIKNSKPDCFDLTNELVKQFRASILMIPYGLVRYGKVKVASPGGCNLGKRPLDMFDDALTKAGIQITQRNGNKFFQIVGKPKKNIMQRGFSVTTTEALLTYLAFVNNFDYEINIYQAATEPHVKNLIDFLNFVGADITLGVDHNIVVKPSRLDVKEESFKIIGDYIEAGTYFAIGAGTENSELIIKGCNVDDLSAMYDIAQKIGVNFKILDKYTIKVDSYNKPNYQAIKLESRIFPGFPSDLQSIFATLLTQVKGVSKVFETMYEGRFSYLAELEKMGADVEIMNPHQVIILGRKKLTGAYVASKDLRCGASLVFAGLMAKGDTHILYENTIFRGYENIVDKLTNVGAKIAMIDARD